MRCGVRVWVLWGALLRQAREAAGPARRILPGLAPQERRWAGKEGWFANNFPLDPVIK